MKNRSSQPTSNYEWDTLKENILHELRQFFWHENCWALNPDGPQMLQVDAEINILEPPGQGWQGQLGRRI